MDGTRKRECAAARDQLFLNLMPQGFKPAKKNKAASGDKKKNVPKPRVGRTIPPKKKAAVTAAARNKVRSPLTAQRCIDHRPHRAGDGESRSKGPADHHAQGC